MRPLAGLANGRPGDAVVAIPIVAALVAAGALVALANPMLLVLAGAAVGLVLIALVSAISPRTAVGLVFAVSTLSGLTVSTPIGVLRLDQAVVLPALCGVLARWATARDATSPVIRRVPAFLAVCLGLYVLANFGSTVLMALDVASSLRVALWLSLSYAAFLLTIIVASRFSSEGALLDGVLVISTLACGVAVVLYGLGILGLSTFGIQTDPISGQLSAKGTFLEANLLGSYAAINGLLAATQLIHSHGHGGRRRKFLRLAVAISAAATYLSYTRAAWLGLVAGGLVLLLVSRPPSGRARTMVQGLLISVVTGAVLLTFGLGSQFVDRALSLVTDSTGTIASRSSTYGLALGGIADHLWLGLGTNSFGQHFLDASSYQGRAYLPGLFVGTLWDVGFVGLASLLIAFAAVATKLHQGFASGNGVVRYRAAGFSAAFVCALVAYQATNGFWFAYTWILIGLAASIPVGLAVRESSQRVPGAEDGVRPLGSGLPRLRAIATQPGPTSR